MLNYLVDFYQAVILGEGTTKEDIVDQWAELKFCIKYNFSDKPASEIWQLMISKNPYKDNFAGVLKLVKIMLVIPVTSAECERVVSSMNRIKTDERSCLPVSVVDRLESVHLGQALVTLNLPNV